MPSTLARLASVLTYPLTPTDFLAVLDPRHSTRQLRGVVTGVTRETADAVTVAFRPGPGWRAHRAGEWVRVGVEIDGTRHWRPFTISAPEGDEPSITVQATGRVSAALVEKVRRGDVLFLDRPQGEFLLPETSGPLLFLTAGSGITPAHSMISTLLLRRPGADVALVHSARTPERTIFAEAFDRLAATHAGLRVSWWHTAESERLDLSDAAALDRLVPDWRERTAYVCGPAGFNAAAEALWAAEVPARTPRVERFTLVRHDGSVGEGGRVSFAASGKSVDAAGDVSLLEAGEGAGVPLPCGCRMGICRTCLTRLTSGSVRDLVTGEVYGEPGDLIRTCVSAAAGDVHLEA